MTDLKEDYYFGFVPRHEAGNPSIDWKVYHSILNVVLTYSAVEARLARFLAEWDLFPSAFNLLTILARTDGEGMHLSKISELLAVSRANVTGLVDVLARKGLVRRVSSSADRRVRLAMLTPEGSQLIQDILPRYYQFNAGLCNSISDQDSETMVNVLSRIREAVENEMKTAESPETDNGALQ